MIVILSVRFPTAKKLLNTSVATRLVNIPTAQATDTGSLVLSAHIVYAVRKMAYCNFKNNSTPTIPILTKRSIHML